MALPILPLAAGGAVLLLLLSKKADAKAPYTTAPPDGSKPASKEPAPPAKTWKEMPPALQEQVAAALGALTVSPSTGQVEGTPTADAIKLATQTAALCESQGFYEVAKELNRLAGVAAKKVPTPPEAATIKQSAPPGLSPEQVEAIARTLTLDRDPKSIQALIVSLEKLPPSPQRDNFIQMAQALLLQLAAAQSTTQTMQQIDEVIRSPGLPQLQQAIQPLPPVVVPVSTAPASSASPAKPPAPIVVSPTPAAPAAPKPPTAEQITKVLGSRILQLGMSGSDVLGWQQWLQRDGYPNVKADRKFGPETTAATKSWQSAHGLTPDGKVGPLTKGKIGTPAVRPAAALSEPAPKRTTAPAKPAPAAAPAAPAAVPSGPLNLDMFPDPNPSAPIIKQGSPKSDYVASFQKVLNTFGFPVGTPDGVFGPTTTKQTKAFQAWSLGYYKDKRIVPDGVVGPITRRLVRMRAAELVRDSNKAAA